MRIVLAALALLLVAANGPCGQPETNPGIVYVLGDDAGITRGCFPPLLCPTVLGEGLRGTFRLRFLAARDLVDVYEIRDVDWLGRIDGVDVPIEGSGLYLDGVAEDWMRLALRVGDEPVEIFDGGPTASGPPAEDGIAITVSIHGQSYFDTVIDVRARPLALVETACGPLGLTCDRDTEVCVARTPIGPAILFGCEPVPVGCEDDRSCDCAGAALCEPPFGVCRETAANALECECPMCQ